MKKIKNLVNALLASAVIFGVSLLPATASESAAEHPSVESHEDVVIEGLQSANSSDKEQAPLATDTASDATAHETETTIEQNSEEPAVSNDTDVDDSLASSRQHLLDIVHTLFNHGNITQESLDAYLEQINTATSAEQLADIEMELKRLQSNLDSDVDSALIAAKEQAIERLQDLLNLGELSAEKFEALQDLINDAPTEEEVTLILNQTILEIAQTNAKKVLDELHKNGFLTDKQYAESVESIQSATSHHDIEQIINEFVEDSFQKLEEAKRHAIDIVKGLHPSEPLYAKISAEINNAISISTIDTIVANARIEVAKERAINILNELNKSGDLSDAILGRAISEIQAADTYEAVETILNFYLDTISVGSNLEFKTEAGKSLWEEIKGYTIQDHVHNTIRFKDDVTLDQAMDFYLKLYIVGAPGTQESSYDTSLLNLIIDGLTLPLVQANIPALLDANGKLPADYTLDKILELINFLNHFEPLNKNLPNATYDAAFASIRNQAAEMLVEASSKLLNKDGTVANGVTLMDIWLLRSGLETTYQEKVIQDNRELVVESISSARHQIELQNAGMKYVNNKAVKVISGGRDTDLDGSEFLQLLSGDAEAIAEAFDLQQRAYSYTFNVDHEKSPFAEGFSTTIEILDANQQPVTSMDHLKDGKYFFKFTLDIPEQANTFSHFASTENIQPLILETNVQGLNSETKAETSPSEKNNSKKGTKDKLPETGQPIFEILAASGMLSILGLASIASRKRVSR